VSSVPPPSPPGSEAPPPAGLPPPPPPPPPGPTFDAAGQARAVFSQLDPTGWRPTATVGGIILALFLGSQLFNAIIPVAAVGPGVPGPGGPVGPGPAPTTGPGPGPITTPLPPGSTLTIGPLAMPLESGWVPQDVPDSGVIVRLVKGGVAIDVFSAPVSGQADAAAVYVAYMNELAGAADGFGATQPNALSVGNGIPAARGTYTGVFGASQAEGQVTTLALGAQGWIFDIWSGSGALRSLLPEAQAMVDGLRVQ